MRMILMADSTAERLSTEYERLLNSLLTNTLSDQGRKTPSALVKYLERFEKFCQLAFKGRMTKPQIF
jgi:hypothetical protein